MKTNSLQPAFCFCVWRAAVTSSDNGWVDDGRGNNGHANDEFNSASGTNLCSDSNPPKDYLRAKQAAFLLLAYRPRSVEELRGRLKERFSEQAVEQTLTGLQRQGLLDDAAFAREWRRQREKNRPRGPAAIANELRRLGVDSEVVEEALADFDAAENAYRAAARYASRLSHQEFPEFRRKLWAFLQRRGFDSSVVRQTVDRLWQELFDSTDGHVDSDPDED